MATPISEYRKSRGPLADAIPLGTRLSARPRGITLATEQEERDFDRLCNPAGYESVDGVATTVTVLERAVRKSLKKSQAGGAGSTLTDARRSCRQAGASTITVSEYSDEGGSGLASEITAETESDGEPPRWSDDAFGQGATMGDASRAVKRKSLAARAVQNALQQHLQEKMEEKGFSTHDIRAMDEEDADDEGDSGDEAYQALQLSVNHQRQSSIERGTSSALRHDPFPSATHRRMMSVHGAA